MAHILSVAVADRFGILVADQGQMLDTEATSTFHIKSPLNTPLETFALGQCVPSWTLRKSLRQRGIESNWLVKGTTLICARDVGH